jgi:DeoR/GlpR family transcriptional regulator of sugar metabolism
MSIEDLIKSELLILFDNGLNEIEAYEEISKSHDEDKISQKSVNEWFEVFKTGEQSLDKSIAKTSKKKLTDEYLIALIEENPDFSMSKLAVLAGTSRTTISRRIRQLNNSQYKVKYVSKKHIPKITDEFLIDLVNKNPDLNTAELARIANTSQSTISNKLRQLNKDSEKVKYIGKKRVSKFTDEFIIDLVNKNPDLSMSELAIIASSAMSTIWTRISQINSSGERVKYVKKVYKPSQFGASKSKLTDEYVIDLINENPSLNMHELAQLANVSQMTILRRINQIKDSGKSVNYIDKKREYNYSDEFLISLINENPNLNITELAKLANATPNFIFRSIRRINSKGIKANYINKTTIPSFTDEFLRDLVIKNPDLSVENLAKIIDTSNLVIVYRLGQIKDKLGGTNCSGNSASNFTDEYIIELINENPDLSLKKLSKLLGISPTGMSNRIKKINSNGERARYISKRYLKDNVESCDLSNLNSNLSNEFLTRLVIENPDLGMKELAKLANTSVQAISARFKQIDWISARDNYSNKNSDIVEKNRG